MVEVYLITRLSTNEGKNGKNSDFNVGSLLPLRNIECNQKSYFVVVASQFGRAANLEAFQLQYTISLLNNPRRRARRRLG